jgi:hypothetical protein
MSQETIKEILQVYHKMSGHGSPNTIKFMLKQAYSWKGMYRDVDEFCSRCLICSQARKERVNTKNRIIIVVK